mgnify:CR=1 FL=1
MAARKKRMNPLYCFSFEIYKRRRSTIYIFTRTISFLRRRANLMFLQEQHTKSEECIYVKPNLSGLVPWLLISNKLCL